VVTVEQITSGQDKIALVGLGYVGLPLSVAFAKKAKVVGFDNSEKKVAELRSGFDSTGEVSATELSTAKIDYTTDPVRLGEARFIIPHPDRRIQEPRPVPGGECLTHHRLPSAKGASSSLNPPSTPGSPKRLRYRSSKPNRD